jgi:hypothetical protein
MFVAAGSLSYLKGKKWGRVIDKFPMYRIEKTNLDGLINKTIVLTFQQTLYL